MDWWYCKEKNLFLLSNFATKPKNALFLSNMVLKIIFYC